jgi:hypothetical protein
MSETITVAANAATGKQLFANDIRDWKEYCKGPGGGWLKLSTCPYCGSDRLAELRWVEGAGTRPNDETLIIEKEMNPGGAICFNCRWCDDEEGLLKFGITMSDIDKEINS